MKEIKAKMFPFVIDVVFWLLLTSMIGVALYFYSGKNPAYFWVMLVCGFLVSARNLLLCMLLAADLIAKDAVASSMIVIGRERYWVNKPFIKWPNMEKPFYYTLFTRQPITPFLLDLKMPDGKKIVLILSVPRQLFEKPLAVNEAVQAVYGRRSRIIMKMTRFEDLAAAAPPEAAQAAGDNHLAGF
jgi:hypothetical protein